MRCMCGCGEELTGRQQRFRGDDHRARYWKDCRHKGALGRGLSALIPSKPVSRPHCGHPGRSKRLARTLNAIMDGNGAVVTTLEIQRKTGSMKPSTDVDDLRRAGYQISMAQYIGLTSEGRKVYGYKWEGKK